MLISTIFSKRKFTISMILLSIILLAVVPFFSPPYMIISLITILMYIILTLSWTMFSGPTNYISLATAALFGVGVYASAVLNELLPLIHYYYHQWIVEFPARSFDRHVDLAPERRVFHTFYIRHHGIDPELPSNGGRLISLSRWDATLSVRVMTQFICTWSSSTH